MLGMPEFVQRLAAKRQGQGVIVRRESRSAAELGLHSQSPYQLTKVASGIGMLLKIT